MTDPVSPRPTPRVCHEGSSFCIHGVHESAPCAACAEDVHGANRPIPDTPSPVDPEEAAARLTKVVRLDGAKYRPLHAHITALLTERERLLAVAKAAANVLETRAWYMKHGFGESVDYDAAREELTAALAALDGETEG